MNKIFLLFSFIFQILSFNLQAAHIFLTGNPIDKKVQQNFEVCLAGGGSDNEWSEGWKDLLQNSNGGDVVIVRADGTRGGYEDWIFNDTDHLNFPQINSIRTIQLTKATDTNSQKIIEIFTNAEFIFFAGGDQSLYIKWLRNSKALHLIQTRLSQKKIIIAGTSAGMALLGGIDYTGQFNSPVDNESNVTSYDVLNNPTGQFVDLKNDVLIPPFMNNVINETHFSERNREGRIMGFMARAISNKNLNSAIHTIKAIAADEGTAFCYRDNGAGKIYGRNSIYFLSSSSPVNQIYHELPLHWVSNEGPVKVYKINSQTKLASFNLQSWSGQGGENEFWSVKNGVFYDTPARFNQ